MHKLTVEGARCQCLIQIEDSLVKISFGIAFGTDIEMKLSLISGA